MSRRLLPALALLAACQGAPTERPDTLVNLATVQSGPRVQADELDGAIRQQPDNTDLLARRATLRLAAGQPIAALHDVETALAADDQNGDLYFLQARALRALGRLTQALAAARRAADNGFNSPELPLLEGETHLAARQYDAALTSLDRTLRLDPDQPAALFYKGLAYAATADTAQALDYLQAAHARDPRQTEILHQLAFLLNAYRVPEEAATYAAQGLRLDSASGTLHYDYGRQLELLGRPDSALRYYRRALALDTTQYRADYRLALAASAHGQRPASVIPHLQRALRRNPRLPGARIVLAEALEAQHRVPEALRQFRLLVAENPGNQHWTYKVWKTGEQARLLLPDSLRPARTYYSRPATVAPLVRPQPIEQLKPR
ncbi:tetratricopeptide repeat protein [Hymenobacter sp. H14-R3]|uniref:tetratricopeptide repeat protein n=1 Tax=Hymenobacter sp. H14-R3 TaxID=3046308 RepID=UPI0024BB17FE|nr:tetratricopeptide repeat protein [Hymenobacter sp. H14-R3]MDJ0365365.1 tetratricopeptide repeat protein [Hymenobacter sp. H14-R3]